MTRTIARSVTAPRALSRPGVRGRLSDLPRDRSRRARRKGEQQASRRPPTWSSTPSRKFGSRAASRMRFGAYPGQREEAAEPLRLAGDEAQRRDRELLGGLLLRLRVPSATLAAVAALSSVILAWSAQPAPLATEFMFARYRPDGAAVADGRMELSSRRPPECRLGEGGLSEGDDNAQVPFIHCGLSVLLALGLAAWEVYFFWYAGSLQGDGGTLGLFTPDRLGFNLAWLAAIYLTFQLLSIPFVCQRQAPVSSAWSTEWPRSCRSRSC